MHRRPPGGIPERSPRPDQAHVPADHQSRPTQANRPARCPAQNKGRIRHAHRVSSDTPTHPTCHRCAMASHTGSTDARSLVGGPASRVAHACLTGPVRWESALTPRSSDWYLTPGGASTTFGPQDPSPRGVLALHLISLCTFAPAAAAGGGSRGVRRAPKSSASSGVHQRAQSERRIDSGGPSGFESPLSV